MTWAVFTGGAPEPQAQSGLRSAVLPVTLEAARKVTGPAGEKLGYALWHTVVEMGYRCDNMEAYSTTFPALMRDQLKWDLKNNGYTYIVVEEMNQPSGNQTVWRAQKDEATAIGLLMEFPHKNEQNAKGTLTFCEATKLAGPRR
ncbi:hypothetical protein [Deinococcus hopiensis]|nr:hypothetical protein [Deinococcus hopiensis]